MYEPLEHREREVESEFLLMALRPNEVKLVTMLRYCVMHAKTNQYDSLGIRSTAAAAGIAVAGATAAREGWNLQAHVEQWSEGKGEVDW